MTQSSVGLNRDGSVPQSPPTSPLGAGTYSVQASYSGDNNYLATAGSCETFSVAQGSASTTTVIDDAATGGPWTGTEAPGSAAIAGATVSGISGLTPTGTVSYTLYNNGSCSGTPAQTSTKSIVGNQVADSDPTSSLAAGTYSFQATYSGDANYVGSIGSCQSFTVPVPYIAIAPTRLFDTRYGTGGVAQAPLGPGQILKVKVLGTAAVPANSNATAVALNLTAVGATAPTYLTVWPDGTSRPTASNLNPYDARAAPNFDVVAIGSDGYIDIYNAAGSVNLLADVAGYVT
jgi:hypothetical protein